MILINREPFNSEEFHNGEVIFKKTPVISQERNIIEMYFKDNRDIANLMFARQWLTDVALPADCDLVMKYCPYERMDREINDQLFSMKYFAEILGKFNFKNIFILDPHSEVCVEQLENQGLDVYIIDLEGYVRDVIRQFGPDYICYPDKGAYTKYPKVLKNINITYFYGQKTRDLANQGKITDYELVDAPDLKDKKVLIIDDICCLGGTAYNAALKMKEAGASEVAFYISHCEDGIFAGKILNEDTIYEYKEEVVDIIKLEDGKSNKTGEQKTLKLNIPVGKRYIIDRVYTADTMLLSKTHNNITIVD